MTKGRYFDAIVPDEFGVREKILFFLKRQYWGFGKRYKEEKDLASWTTKIQAQHLKSLNKFNKRAPGGDQTEPPEVTVGEPEVSQQRDGASDPTLPTSLRVLHLRKTYSHFAAVQDSSFTMPKGSLLAILGANGSGKSTTCHVLCGITPATSGGAVLNDQSDLLSRGHMDIGWCPQHDILFDQLTALEHVSPLHLRLRVD